MTQVSGSVKSLLDSIRDGEVERPNLMRWNAWQQWRSLRGKRPTAAADGAATTTALESALWKSVMLELYGTEWSIQLASMEEEATAAVAEAQPSRPSLEPAAGGPSASVAPPQPTGGAGTPEPASLVTPRRTEVSPGSGELPRTGAAGPGSGLASPVPSWSSGNPGTPKRLTHAVVQAYNPEKEVLEKYIERITRQARALELLQEPLGAGILEALKSKAAYELRIYEEAKGDFDRQLRLLKREYAFELLDVDGSEAQAGRVSALETMLEARGINTAELRGLVIAGAEVAPTPQRPTAAAMPTTGGLASSETRQLQLGPRYPEVAQFQIHGTGDATPVYHDSMAVGQIAALEERLRNKEVELAAHKLHSAASIGATPPIQLAEVLEKQTELLRAVIDRPKNQPGSTIRVEPKVYWPRLGDDGPGGTEVEEFYDKFEEICGLANSGKGMSDKEMMIALKTCVHGSRRKSSRTSSRPTSQKWILTTDLERFTEPSKHGCSDSWKHRSRSSCVSATSGQILPRPRACRLSNSKLNGSESMLNLKA